MNTIGDQIIEALEEVLADAKGAKTGIRQHAITVSHDEAGTDSTETDSAPSAVENEQAKRRRA